jgi:TRAP-type C4-dicarboxylate transport system permease large subunit
MIHHTRRFLLGLSAAAVLALPTPPAHAQTKLRWAHVYETSEPFHTQSMWAVRVIIGLLHPPPGVVLVVLARVAKLSVERTTIAILPWLVPLMLALIAIPYIPELTLWLPQKMGLGR